MTTSPRAARRAVVTVFAVNGAALSSWFPHIPAVQRKLELSDGALGAALLGVPVRVVVSPRTLRQGAAEVKRRTEEQAALVPLADVPRTVKALLG